MRRLGEPEEAEAHLHRTKEIHSNGEDWRGLTAQVHLAEGIVTTAEKKWQEAEEAFKKALEIHRQYPFPYYEAKCRFEWGQMYLSRNGPGDRERGIQLLDEALGIFQKIQSKKMVEKVLAHKQVLEAKKTSALRFPGLTPIRQVGRNNNPCLIPDHGETCFAP